jgi:hypothetical protein
MKMLRLLAGSAIFAIASLVVGLTVSPQPTIAQLPPGPGIVALTSACTSDPCASTAVASIQVPGGSSVCAGNVWGTFKATGVYEVTNTSQSAVLAQWQSALVTPLNGWISNAGFSTANSRAFAVYFAAPLTGVGWFRVRLSAYTSGTVDVQLSCAGTPFSISAPPGVTPTSSPTP